MLGWYTDRYHMIGYQKEEQNNKIEYQVLGFLVESMFDSLVFPYPELLSGSQDERLLIDDISYEQELHVMHRVSWLAEM